MRTYIKGLSKDVLIYLSGSVITKIAAIFLVPLYTYYLTPADYGVLGYVGSITAYFSMMMLLGLDGTVLRLYFDYRRDSDDARDFLGTVYVFMTLFGILVILLAEIVGQWKPYVFSKNVAYSPFIRLGILNAYASAISSVSFAYYRAERKALRYIGFSIGSFLLSTGIVVYLVAFKGKGALGSLEGSLLGTAVICALFIYDIQKRVHVTIVKDQLVKALKYGLPLVPGSIAGWVMLYSGRLYIERYSSLRDLGIFSLGFNVASVLLLGIVGFTAAWYPFFFATITVEGGEKIIARIVTLYVATLLFVVMVLNAFAFEAIHLMANRRYWDSYQVIPLLALGLTFQGLYYMPSSIVLYRKKTHSQAIIAAIIAALSLLLNYWLTPRYGMIGVCWTVVFSYAMLCLCNFALGRRYMSLPYEYQTLATVFVVFMLIYGTISFINLAAIDYRLVYKTGLILLFAVSIYLTGVFSESEKRWIRGHLPWIGRPVT